MSNQSSSYSSYTRSSYSTSSSTNLQGHSNNYTETTTSHDRDGTSVQRTTEETGKPTLQDETYIPLAGRLGNGGGGDASGRRIEDVSDEQAKRNAEYEERMEDEYAKREGGA